MEKLPKFPEEHLLVETLKTPAAVEKYEKLSLGNQIRRLRIRAHMKQSQLAKKLKTSQSAVARMEAGKQNFTVSILVRLSFVFEKKIHLRFQ